MFVVRSDRGKKDPVRGLLLLTKITAAQNDVALSYQGERGLYLLAVIFAASIVESSKL